MNSTQDIPNRGDHGDGDTQAGIQSNIQAEKQRWRTQLLAARAEVSPQERERRNRALAAGLFAHLDQFAEPARTIAAYVPVGSEPGDQGLLDALLARGLRVLLPVVEGRQRPLNWVVYTGPESLRKAGYGLLEPIGERLGAEALAQADVILTPGLAVDSRGVRLGRGAGYYDLSLATAQQARARDQDAGQAHQAGSKLPKDPEIHRTEWAQEGTSLETPQSKPQVIGMVDDAECVVQLPSEGHDVRLGWVLTPDQGVRALVV